MPQIKTLTRKIANAGILEVDVGTTGLQGSDAATGSRTYLRIQDAGGNTLSVRTLGSPGDPSEGVGFELTASGDGELCNLLEALDYAAATLRESFRLDESEAVARAREVD